PAKSSRPLKTAPLDISALANPAVTLRTLVLVASRRRPIDTARKKDAKALTLEVLSFRILVDLVFDSSPTYSHVPKIGSVLCLHKPVVVSNAAPVAGRVGVMSVCSASERARSERRGYVAAVKPARRSIAVGLNNHSTPHREVIRQAGLEGVNGNSVAEIQ